MHSNRRWPFRVRAAKARRKRAQHVETMNDRTGEHTPKLQACAVPYRRSDGQLEFCLITSSEGRWTFPKGNIDPGETAEHTALKEALEEAGLRGTILGEPLGSYQLETSDAKLDVAAMLMAVESCDSDWEEADRRERRWVTLGQARELIKQNGLHEMIDAAVDKLES